MTTIHMAKEHTALPPKRDWRRDFKSGDADARGLMVYGQIAATARERDEAELEAALREFERTDRIMGFFLCLAALIAAVSVGMLVL